jgi:hypothetical protein
MVVEKYWNLQEMVYLEYEKQRVCLGYSIY